MCSTASRSTARISDRGRSRHPAPGATSIVGGDRSSAATTLVLPMVSIDHYDIGDGTPGEVTRKLQGLYNDAVRGRLEKYRHWLTPVWRGNATKAAAE